MFSYYLPSGKYFPVQIINLFNRCEIAPYVSEEEKDIYFQIYMTGKTGNQDLRILLDEVNAYTFSVINALYLAPVTGGSMDREGLATMMWYLELYLHHARMKEKGDFRKIVSHKGYLSLIKILWENAEKVLADSSQYESYGMNERYKLKRVYDGENLDELHAAFEKSTIKIDFDDTIYDKYNLDEEIKPVVIPFDDKEKLDEFLNDL